ncbi:DUF3723 domain-containing protein [Aspergillus foveolatus]|uniref:DUF3723 domain-containing protein n=1 Tax=Aspergillus foveolatus TaxID=210207 RepID=UPI003CCD0369
MRRALFTEREVRLATERRLKYLGTAKVSINQIQFEPPLPRDLDSKNVARLREIFRKNQCRRLDVDNHVPATVSQQDLAVALQNANVSQQSLLTNNPPHFPELRFAAGQLRALHGRHRVQAGAEVLPPADRWWTIDLYLDDIGEELRASLLEEYANQKKPTDGEIYRKIRQYEGEGNEAFRERWFVRLSPSNQDRLDQLDNRRNRRLRRAFDRLLSIPGLWPNGMRISMLHRLIATGCVEEILTYLDHIEDFWSSLVASDRDLMKKIDLDTVETLQLLAPGRSRTDAKTARGLILGGQAFATFNDGERRAIWSRLESFDGLVPSLYTFFEDFKYLESCAHCVKRLFSPSAESVWKTMSSMFAPTSEEESIIQTSESTFRRERVTRAEGLDKGYVQVWLYAMRHYPLMPPDPKKDDDLLAKPTRVIADKRAVYEMAELAHRLGFRSPEIGAIINSSPDHQIAREALLQARKPNRFRYDAQQFDILVSRIVDCFAAAVPDQPEVCQDLLADNTVKPRARCGMPRMGSHKQDSLLLFLDHLHMDNPEVADTITTFFVRRCVYFSFFGKSAQPGPTGHCQTREHGADAPQSPLFVEEAGSSNNQRAAPHVAEPSEPAQQGQQEVQLRQDRVRRTLHHQQVSRAGRERRILKKRRKQKFHRQQRPADAGSPEPMEYEWVSEEPSDQDMSDQGRSTLELPGADLAITPWGPSNGSSSASNPLNRTQSPIADQGENTNKRCTRILPEAVPLERDVEETTMIEAPNPDGENQEQVETDQPPRLEVGSPRDDQDGQQQTSDAYLNQLMRAEKEQERLEEEMERERLEGELGILNPNPPVPETERQNLLRGTAELTGTDLHSALTDIPEPTQHPSPTAEVGPRLLMPPGQVEISFWTFERGGWKHSDCFRVDPSDPSPVERAARKYTWKNYSLYDQNLQSLSPAQCYRAATVDGNNKIFVISEYEEKKLAAEGRFTKARQLLLLAGDVSHTQEQVESAPKRRQYRSRSPSETSEEL